MPAPTGRFALFKENFGPRSRDRALGIEQLEPRHVLSPTLLITEFLAANNSGLLDEDGDSSDWIEIHNPTSAGINVDGWFLTDDSDDLDRWQLPAYTIAPGEFLVVFASGKDRTSPMPPTGELHANFSLSADGDYVAIVDSDRVTVVHDYADPFPQQVSDVSYGIDPAHPENGPYYYGAPTPGAPHGIGLVGLATEPTFSVPRGYYDIPQSLFLSSSTPFATIRYTTDGSTPTDSHGTVYSSGIPIAGTKTVRAVSYRTDYLTSTVATHTYVFTGDVIHQSPNGDAPAGWPTGPVNSQQLDYGMDPDIVGGQFTEQAVVDSLESIPTFSLVTDMDHLMDPSTGIFVNATERGEAWERPISVELIHPDNSPGFQSDAGVRIRGGFSRTGNNPKHAFRLFFRGAYDGPLDFPLFGNEGANAFDNIDLRTSQNYSWSFSAGAEASFTREVFSRDTQGDMGWEYTRSRYYHLYINGQYWGLFQTQERSEADFAATYFGGTASDYDVVKHTGNDGGYTIEATDGDLVAWSQLWNLAVALDNDPATNTDNYWAMQGLHPDGTRNESLPKLLDVNNLIDYMLVIFYTGNTDAPLSAFLGNNHPNNWYGIYNQTTQDRGFQFFVHDGEHTLGTSGSEGRGGYDRTGPYDSANEALLLYSNPQFLHQHLMNHPEYRRQFGDRAQKHLLGNGSLTPAASTARFLERVDQVTPAVLAESARWGDAKRPDNPYSIPDWQVQIDEVLGIFDDRSQIVIGQLQDDNLFPDLPAPMFNRPGGQVPAGAPLLMTNPSGQGYVFYTLDGSDPRLIGGGINPHVLFYDATETPTTVLSVGSTWKYLDDGSNQGTAWRGVGFDDSGWSSGPAQLGYGDGDEATTVSFGGDPANKHTTTYFRTTFNVTDWSHIASQTVWLLRDDGAAVYINDKEVVRSNLPGVIGTPIDYQQSALQVVGGSDESTFFQFTIGAEMLVAGENTIAVEVHQAVPDSSDIGFDLQLVANHVGDAIVLDAGATVSARVFYNGDWSPLSRATFFVDVLPADANNFRITEINYHPSAPTAAELMIDPFLDEDDFEFIELRNTGSSRIDLTNVEFVQVGDDGVEFDFSTSPIVELAPGDFVLVVEDTDAFAIRYGPGLPVGGQWTGKLGDGGELLTLRDAAGGTIHSFAYDDENGWPSAPDGDGPTLVVKDTAGYYSDPTNWRASTVILGTPGAEEPVPGDFNGDAAVDGTDFLYWQAGFGRFPGGGATTADGDADGDGDVDGVDFLIWQTYFGFGSAGSGGGGSLCSAPVVNNGLEKRDLSTGDWLPIISRMDDVASNAAPLGGPIGFAIGPFALPPQPSWQLVPTAELPKDATSTKVSKHFERIPRAARADRHSAAVDSIFERGLFSTRLLRPWPRTIRR